MNEVGVEIVKTEETEKSGIKYLNINVSNSEVERKPDIVRLCADAGILEYVKTSGDAINRQAVIDALYELCDTGETLIENPWRDNPHIDVLVDAIEELSSVTPQEPNFCQSCKHYDDNEVCLECEYDGITRGMTRYESVLQEPKTGHWSHDGSHWKNRFICSECRYKLFDEPTNYCPNCGADMRGEI